jgi:hypothetical protein
MHISCPNLFDPDIQVNRKTKRALARYLGGLILYPGKKNCLAIAKAINVNHDIVYDFFECHAEGKEILLSFLKKALYALPLKTGTWPDISFSFLAPYATRRPNWFGYALPIPITGREGHKAGGRRLPYC